MCECVLLGARSNTGSLAPGMPRWRGSKLLFDFVSRQSQQATGVLGDAGRPSRGAASSWAASQGPLQAFKLEHDQHSPINGTTLRLLSTPAPVHHWGGVGYDDTVEHHLEDSKAGCTLDAEQHGEQHPEDPLQGWDPLSLLSAAGPLGAAPDAVQQKVLGSDASHGSHTTQLLSQVCLIASCHKCGCSPRPGCDRTVPHTLGVQVELDCQNLLHCPVPAHVRR